MDPRSVELDESNELEVSSKEPPTIDQNSSSGDDAASNNIVRIYKKRSPVWNHFAMKTITKNNVKHKRAVCNYCGVSYDVSEYGTSRLRLHATTCAPKHIGTSDPFQGQQTYNVSPKFQGVFRNIHTSHAIKAFKQQKVNLIADFAKDNATIACTFSMWKGMNSLSFLVITAHFIDDNWTLQKRIIAFRKMEYPHNGQNIFQTIISVFRDYNIENKIFSITFDNHSAIANSIDIFKHQFHPLINFQLFHARCVCHMINLIIKDGLTFFNDTITLIRNAIHFIRSSNSRIRDFHNFCKTYNLKGRKFVIDTQNRWNTTYLMLKSCREHQVAISDYITLKCDRHMQVGPNDWEIANKVMQFLEVFYTATNVCSSVYHPTSCLIFNQLYNMAICFNEHRNDPTFRAACSAMEEKFRKYLVDLPLLFTLATVMDPRMKLVGVKVMLDGLSDHLNTSTAVALDDVREKLNNIYSMYESKYANDTRNVTSSSSSSSSSEIIHDRLLYELYLKQQNDMTWRNELDRYLGTGIIKDFINIEERDKFDILSWWKRCSYSFPVLSIMARDLLTPPVSTVALEHAFSSSGNGILDQRWSSIQPETLECLMCLRDWDAAAQRSQDRIPQDYDLSAPFTDMDM